MIRGSRIYFRPVELTDLNETYLGWMNDRDVVQYLEIKRPQTLKDLEQYYYNHAMQDDEFWFAIIKIGMDEHIGNIKLGPINWIHRRADLSLFIGRKDLWKKGYGTEAINLITKYAFETLGLHKIEAGVYRQNHGSLRAFGNAGYKGEAILKDHVWSHGEYSDLWIMGRVNE